MSNTPSEQVKIGIIGAGIGSAHLGGYKQSPQANVVAICDMNTERAREMAASHGYTDVAIYADYHEMIEKAGLDGVSVGVPNKFHRPIAVDLLDAGLHVLCEKPLALTAADGQLIADAAARNGKNCMVGQVNRFRRDSQYIKKAIDAGELGEVYYAHTGLLRKCGIPGFGGWFTTKSISGGGPLIDLGVHMLDVTWWMAGCPRPVAVSGITRAAFGPKGKGGGSWGVEKNNSGTFDVEDLAVGIVRFENGLTINLEVSWALHTRQDSIWCELFGDGGGAEWGVDGQEKAIILGEKDGTPFTLTPDLGAGDPWKGQTQHFVDSIINGTTPDPDATQGVQMMKMLAAFYKSAELGREVEIEA
jgi:predicted dehydrogenase